MQRLLSVDGGCQGHGLGANAVIEHLIYRRATHGIGSEASSS